MDAEIPVFLSPIRECHHDTWRNLDVQHLSRSIRRLVIRPLFLSLPSKSQYNTWPNLVHFDDQADENQQF